MSTFPSGVAVVTTTGHDGSPLGLTCSALCSVSLDPPQLLVCVHNRSSTLAAIRDRGEFAVNLLDVRGREASEVFATGEIDRYRRIPWRVTSGRSLPYLFAHAHSVAECEVRSDVRAGDHSILVGEVVGIVSLAAATPLLYGLRRYARWPS